MDFDAQLSLSQLIRSLGLVPLMQGQYKYDTPTASPVTSLFIKLQKLHNAKKSQGKSDSNYGNCVDVIKGKNNYDDNDDTKLLLSDAGCVCCGRSGHNADTCPFMSK